MINAFHFLGSQKDFIFVIFHLVVSPLSSFHEEKRKHPCVFVFKWVSVLLFAFPPTGRFLWDPFFFLLFITLVSFFETSFEVKKDTLLHSVQS